MASSAPSPRGARRRSIFVAVLVLLGGVLVTFTASRLTGPAFSELARLAVVPRATQLARAVTDIGPSAMVSGSARAIYQELTPHGIIPGLLSGWLGEVFAHAGWLDRLTADRLGWLLPTALVPFWVYLIAEASQGMLIGVLAACLTVATPRWLHAAAIGGSGAVVTALWLGIVATYVRSLPADRAGRRLGRAPRFRRAAIAFGVVLGLSLAWSLSALWIVPLIVVHYASRSGKRSFRLARRGRLPVPAALLAGLMIAPSLFVLGSPVLWHGDAASAAEWLFAPLAPSIEPALYEGTAASITNVPSGYPALFLLATTPLSLFILALVGFLLLVIDVRGARHGRVLRDHTALATLVLFAFVTVLFGLAVTPRVLVVFPPRVELALPFIAILGAVAVGRVANVISNRALRGAFVTLVALGSMATCFSGISTASASFGQFSRGTSGAVAARALDVGDGSEVAILAGAIDALGLPRLSIGAPDVPRNYFTVLNREELLKTGVETRGNSGDLLLVRGSARNPLATVERDGATLWTLRRR